MRMVSTRWLTLCVLAAAFGGYTYGQSQSCTQESFPSTAPISSFLNASQGSEAHKRYVMRFFEDMKTIQGRCSASASRTRSLFSGISQPMFAEGVADRIWQQHGLLSFTNARVLVNLLANSPPTNSEDQSKASYCFSGDPECSDCNTWYNNLFLESLLRSTLESQSGLTASGVCLRSNATHMTCREASVQGAAGIVNNERSVEINSCDDSWLWQKPMESVMAHRRNGGFSSLMNVTIVPAPFYNDTLVSYYTDPAGDTIPVVPATASSWSTLHSQCYPNGTTQWVVIHTTPVIATCNQRLINAGLCGRENSSQLVQVGSSWVAVAVNESFNITQCPASGPQENIFPGSATCDNVGSGESNLACIDMPRGFTPNTYVCKCPQGSYLDPAAPGNVTRLASSERVYDGSFIAAEVGARNLSQLSFSTCLACQAGCRECIDSSPCLRENNIGLRTPLLVINLLVIIVVVLVGVFVVQNKDAPVIRSGAPYYLYLIIISAVVAGIESIVLFPRLNNDICALQPWPRHIGFILLFGFAFGKIWRVQILARMPPGRIRISTLDSVMHRIIFLFTTVVGLYLILWTAISPSSVEIVYNQEGQSYERCSSDYWRYVIHGCK